MELARKELE
jgi:CheY-like chemotaxis protein